jgi:hypothetical protein
MPTSSKVVNINSRRRPAAKKAATKPVAKRPAKKVPAKKAVAKKVAAPVQATDGRRERGDATKLEILEAAREYIDTYDKVPTVQEVANRSNRALRTIYHHFPDAASMVRHALALEPRRSLTVVIEPA